MDRRNRRQTPGNPVSAMVTFDLFVRPTLRALLGAHDAPRPQATAILDEAYPKEPACALGWREPS